MIFQRTLEQLRDRLLEEYYNYKRTVIDTEFETLALLSFCAYQCHRMMRKVNLKHKWAQGYANSKLLTETTDDWKCFEKNYLSKIDAVRNFVCLLASVHAINGDCIPTLAEDKSYYCYVLQLHSIIVFDFCFLYPHRLQCYSYCASVGIVECVVDDALFVTDVKF